MPSAIRGVRPAAPRSLVRRGTPPWARTRPRAKADAAEPRPARSRPGIFSIPKLFSITRFARIRGGWRREDGKERSKTTGYERTETELVNEALGLAEGPPPPPPPPPPGGGGGSGGGSFFNRFGHEDGWWHLRGYGMLVSVLFCACKTLVTWCSASPTDAAGMCDLGFLFCCAMLALASLFPSIAVLRPILVELIGVHILCEMLFYGAILPRWDPDFKMGPDMWTHHGATVVGAAYLLYVGAVYGAVFWWIGCQLIITEITTFLPIAFHQATKSRRVKGTRSMVLGALMPTGFALRTALSMKVVYNFVEALKYSAGTVPLWGIGLGAGCTIACLNVYWTIRIIKGTIKAMRKQRSAPVATK